MPDYYVHHQELKYTKSRRGVNATAKIRKRNGDAQTGHIIATVVDVAEAISVPVTFLNENDRYDFLVEAETLCTSESLTACSQPPSEDFVISEYARQLISDAEQQYLQENS